MNPVSTFAWSMVLLFAGWWTFLRIVIWRDDRRARRLRDEIVKVAVDAGFSMSELSCQHGVLIGDVCRTCDSESR